MYYAIAIVLIIVFCFFAAYVIFVTDQLKAIIDRFERKLDEHSKELNDMRGWIDKLSYNVFRRRRNGE